MKNFTHQTKFSELSNFTVGEFIKEISFDIGKEVLKFIKTELKNYDKTPEPQFVYGLKGLANILQCSKTKALEIKQSGKLNAAIFQEKEGGTLKIDVKKVQEFYFDIKD